MPCPEHHRHMLAINSLAPETKLGALATGPDSECKTRSPESSPQARVSTSRIFNTQTHWLTYATAVLLLNYVKVRGVSNLTLGSCSAVSFCSQVVRLGSRSLPWMRQCMRCFQRRWIPGLRWMRRLRLPRTHHRPPRPASLSYIQACSASSLC